MNKDVIKKAQEILEKSDALAVPDLEVFVHDTLKFFEELREILIAGSEEDKKEAMETAAELQEKFQQLAEKAYKTMGLTPEQMKAFLAPKNFSSDEWKTYQNVQHDIQDYEKTILKKDDLEKARVPKSKRSSRREKI